MSFMNLKAHASRSVLAALAVCTLLPLPATAAPAPVFIPAMTWKVGTTQLSNVRGLESMNMPCVLSNEFDNGYLVRLSGGGGKMLAMAIDFRQDVFHQGRKYNAMLSIGDGYVKQVEGTAFTTSTLIFNLRPISDFYEKIRGGSQMGLDIDGNAMEFSLGDLATAYGDFESCYTGTKPMLPVAPMVSASAAVTMPNAPPPVVETVAANPPQSIVPPLPPIAPMPQSFGEIVRNADAANSPSTTPATPPFIPVATWNAKAGEDIKAVLMRWSQNAGYDLQWQADQNAKVVQDVALHGSFEDAVSQLIAENSATMGVDARIQNTQGTRQIIQQPASGNSVMTPEPVPVVTAAPIPSPNEWQAPAGANIQTVLEQWGGRAGVAVQWQSYMSVPVKKAVNMRGGFEEAVQALLDQYSSDSRRPVGQLNVDPKTGERTLLISMDAAGAV